MLIATAFIISVGGCYVPLLMCLCILNQCLFILPWMSVTYWIFLNIYFWQFECGVQMIRMKTSTFITDHSKLVFHCLQYHTVWCHCVVDERLLESSESYKAASQRASLEVERLRAENEDLKQQLDAGFAYHCCCVCALYLPTFNIHLLQIMPLYSFLQCFDTVALLTWTTFDMEKPAPANLIRFPG